MASETPHAADQAGGEVVYSSDGLDPLPVPSKPPRVRISTPTTANEDAASGDGLVSEAVSAEEAFEVFAGKLYPPTEQNMTNQTYLRTAETPLQRLGRLQAELDGLQSELSSATTTTTTENDELKLMMEKLKLQLEETTTRILPQRQEQLTRNIAESSSAAAATTAPPTDGPAPTTAATTSSAELEQRLLRLETAVGSGGSSSTSSSSSTLLERLTRLEQISSKLDADQADAWQRRAKTIRQDLEAASKARNKLAASAAGGPGGGGANVAAAAATADTKTLTDLYNLSSQLHGLADHLPALAQRLQAVSHLHVQASTWSGRLQAAEQVATALQHQVTSVEEAVGNLQTSFAENAAMMQENIKVLEEQKEK